MKIALIGNGAMGQLVAAEARAAGDEIGAVVTSKERNLEPDELAERIRGCDVAIDFSVGEAVLRNIEACARAGVPLVEGTTGWKAHEATAKQIVTEHNAALVYGANFSIGVNLFYRIADRAAALFASVNGYAPFIEEAHHMRKRDAPSGTALQLRELMAKHLGPEIPASPVRIASVSTPKQIKSCLCTPRDREEDSHPEHCSPRTGLSEGPAFSNLQMWSKTLSIANCQLPITRNRDQSAIGKRKLAIQKISLPWRHHDIKS
jgi:4-hydroxy-tetrahydrodipicolinate reductase